jgi:NADH-quinone oxidoreductase subunit L
MYVFHGEENYDHDKVHPHETYPFVIAAMTPLALLAISAGWMQASFVEMVTKILPPLEVHATSMTVWILIIVTSAIALAGIALAVFKFKKDGTYYSEKMKDRFCYKLLANQYYFPHLIEACINKPYLAVSKFSWKELDLKLIDAIVDGIANGFYAGGESGTAMQSGNLSKGLKWMGIGIAVLLILVVAFGNLK